MIKPFFDDPPNQLFETPSDAQGSQQGAISSPPFKLDIKIGRGDADNLPLPSPERASKAYIR
jgi:hypothetical protein